MTATHPEVAVNNRHCRDIRDMSDKLLLTNYCWRNVLVVVVDKVHCVIEW